MAKRPAWILRLPAPLLFELGTEVLWVADAEEVEEVDCSLLVVLAELSLLVLLAELSLLEEEVAVAELLSVEVMVELSVEEVPVTMVLSVEVPVAEEADAVTVTEPDATPV